MKSNTPLKKLKKILLAGVLSACGFIALPGQSNPEFSPEKILDLADNGNTTDFLRAVAKLEQASPYITDESKMLQYLRLLPKLDKFSTNLNTAGVLGTDPLLGPAHSITSIALVWLSVEKHSQKDIDIFIRYANPQNLFKYLDNHLGIFRKLTSTPSKFKASYQKFKKSIIQIKKYHRNDLGLIRTAQNHFGTITVAYLRTGQVSMKEFGSLIKEPTSEDAFKEFSNYLRTRAAKSSSTSELKQVFYYSLELMDRFDQADILLPSYLYEQTTQSIANVITKLLTNGGGLDRFYVNRMIKRLEVREMQLIADDILTTPWDLIQPGSKAFVEAFLVKVSPDIK